MVTRCGDSAGPQLQVGENSLVPSENWIIGCAHTVTSSPAAVEITGYHSQSWMQFWSSNRDLSLFPILHF